MIKISGLTKKFQKEIISDFTISFPSGKTSVIIGPSGCGKTTLFNILAGLDTDYKGDIEMDTSVSYIFQEDRLIPWLTSYENLKLVAGDSSDEDINNILGKFHLKDRKHLAARKLSGGEKQRLSIARAFLHNGETLLMDEALRSMDLSLKLKIIEEINGVLEEFEKTMVVISHDIREALLLADTVYVLGGGPMKLLRKIEIDIPKDHRHLYNDNILSIERELYSLLLKEEDTYG